MAGKKKRTQRSVSVKAVIIIIAAALLIVAGCIIYLKITSEDGTVNISSPISISSSDDTAAEETENIDVEPTEPPEVVVEPAVTIYTDGECRNGDVLTLTYNDDGDTVSVGLEDAPDGDWLYFNIVFSAATAEHPYGLYIKSTSESPTYCYGYDVVGTYEDYPDESLFVIRNQSFDTCVPATYYDSENYGIKWRNDEFYDGKSGSDANLSLYCRAVDLLKHEMIVTFVIDITYDEDTEAFYISNLYNNEVNITGDLTAEERETIVNDTIKRLSDLKEYPKLTSATEENISLDKTIVEHVKGLYFNQYLDVNGETGYSANVYSCDVYAVNIHVNAYGILTFYYMPEAQLGGMSHAGMGIAEGEDKALHWIGYDAILPYTFDGMVTANPNITFMTIEELLDYGF